MWYDRNLFIPRKTSRGGKVLAFLMSFKIVRDRPPALPAKRRGIKKRHRNIPYDTIRI